MTMRQSTFPDGDFRAAGYKAVDLIADYLANIRDRPVYQPMPSETRNELMDLPFPDQAQDMGSLIDRFAADILPYPMGNGHPRFFGWVNSPPDPAGIIAEMLAAGLDPSCAGGDHAAIYLERAVTRWLAELVRFPLENGMGLLVSGGSMASLTAIASARHAAATRDGWNDRKEGLKHAPAPLVMYLSPEGHTTMVKAAELIGIGSNHVRYVPVDGDLRMDAEALRRLVHEDREAGFRPFLVAGSAGTVSTGAVDPFNAIADVCAEEGLWFHIDGAYGAVGVIDPRNATLFAGMERADSLALDPHKWLSVPVECGCVLIRDAGIMRDTFSLVPAYLRTEEQRGIGGLPWFSEYGFQQTRGFRALKVWMTLAATGKDGLVETIRRHNDLAKTLAGMIRETPGLELFCEPTLSIVCFRVKAGADATAGADSDGFNKRIMEIVQSSGRAFVTQASLNGAFWLRASVLHFGTTEDDLSALIDAVLDAAQEIASTDTAA